MSRWIKWTAVMLILMLGAMTVYAASYPIVSRRGGHGAGWVIQASDDDVDASAELITELDTTFAQLDTARKIYAISSAAGDTSQTLYVSGVNSAGKYITEEFSLNGTTASTASSATYSYVDQTWVDKECAGTISIKRYTGTATLINSIEIGSLRGDVAQKFNGHYVSYVQRWWATSATSNEVTLELRWYPDDADCLDAADGFMLLDKIYMANGIYKSGIHNFSQNPDEGIRLPAGGWIAVYGTGGAANQEASVTVVGFDRRR